jgi:hypothetical protein
MTLLRHVLRCNAHNPADYLPLCRGGLRVGLTRRDNAAKLRGFPDVFAVADERVDLVAEGGFDAVSEAVDAVLDRLVADGAVPKWRNEFFTVAPRWGAEPLFRVDRGAVPFFGVRGYGVHMNGFCRTGGGGLILWIGRRAPDKKVAPNLLDNVVAGGIGGGHGVVETLVKEGGEEADLPPDLMRRAAPVGAVSYRMAVPEGLRDDVMFLYDLELPEAVTPRNTDGEIAEFRRLPAADVVRMVRETDEFKFNVNLVIIDFAVRHGLIGPDDPEYLDLAVGLRRPLD